MRGFERRLVNRQPTTALYGVVRFKVRRVAHGFKQMEWRDYTETVAPVAISSIRVLLALMAVNNYWELDGMDVEAFLQSPMKEVVHVRQTRGFMMASSWCVGYTSHSMVSRSQVATGTRR
jgi:hypothetical protein